MKKILLRSFKIWGSIAMALFVLVSCYTDDGSSISKRLPAAHIAYLYVSSAMNNYAKALMLTYQFNIYLSQTDAAKRDSVDKLYFENVKVLKEGDYWQMRVEEFSSTYLLKVFPVSSTLNATGARWKVDMLEANDSTVCSFEIQNAGGSTWKVGSHQGRNVNFNISNDEWTVVWSTSGSEPQFSIAGSGSMLSIAKPQLRLDYRFTSPLIYEITSTHLSTYTSYMAAIAGGSFAIQATDVDKKETDNISADIIYKDNTSSVRLTYEGVTEVWEF
jgi:hypothetical protein